MVRFIYNGGEITIHRIYLQNRKHKIQSKIFKIKNLFFEFQAADH